MYCLSLLKKSGRLRLKKYCLSLLKKSGRLRLKTFDLIWKAGEENIVPDALSRIFGNIARRVELDKGIEVERMVSVQESEARGMNQDNASTNVDLSDNTPQWLIDCERNEAGKYDIMEAWNAAVKAAHGEVYGVLNPRHRGINATLADAKKYFTNGKKDYLEF